MPGRGEALHRPLALPGRLMRVLGPVVQIPRPPVGHRRHQLAVRHLVAGELVGDDHTPHVPQALEEFAEELLGGQRVSARLHQDVKHIAVLVDRTPQVPLCAVDLHKHLIQVPLIAGAWAPPAQLVGVGLPELGTPGPDGS